LEKELEGTNGYDASLMSYYSDSLKIYALVNAPKIAAPEKGYPALIFGHGFHPEPKKYGVSTETGKDWRPGDYYRGVPGAYAGKGFLVITPDYRGHNKSDGFEYTQKGFLASNYYTIDVLHLLAALPSLGNVDTSHIYYVGHSLGGDVGARTILATNKIKAASLWAPVAASILDQALYYGKYYDKGTEKVDPEQMKTYTSRLDTNLLSLGFEYHIDAGDPINFVQDISTPLIIHHAKGDESVPYIWSESFVAKLFKYDKDFAFYAYDSDNHLFQDSNRIRAVERDIEFFNNYWNYINLDNAYSKLN